MRRKKLWARCQIYQLGRKLCQGYINKEESLSLCWDGRTPNTLMDSIFRTVKRTSYQPLRTIAPTPSTRSYAWVSYVSLEYKSCFQEKGGRMRSLFDCTRPILYIFIEGSHFLHPTESEWCHAQTFSSLTRKDFFRKYLWISFDCHYYFDDLRTGHDLYANVREILRQVNHEQRTSAVMHSNQQSSIHDDQPYTRTADPANTPSLWSLGAYLYSTEVSSITANLAKISLCKADLRKQMSYWSWIATILIRTTSMHTDHQGACKLMSEMSLRLVKAA